MQRLQTRYMMDQELLEVKKFKSQKRQFKKQLMSMTVRSKVDSSCPTGFSPSMN